MKKIYFIIRIGVRGLNSRLHVIFNTEGLRATTPEEPFRLPYRGLKLKTFLVLLIISVSCFSCDQVVQIDVGHENTRLVVNSLFNPDSVITLTLSHSQFILEEALFEPVSGARAILLDEEGMKLGEMAYVGNGIYKSNIEPDPGKLYSISVSKEGLKTVTAYNKVPAKKANVVKIETKPLRDESYNNTTLSFWLNDPEGDDYYVLYLQEKGTVYLEQRDTTLVFSQHLLLTSNEAIFHEFNIDDISDNELATSVSFTFKDDLFDGQIIKITVQAGLRHNKKNEKYEHSLYLRKISKAYYLYQKTVKMQERNGENPFSEPVPVYNNIQNGFGIFAGFNVASYPVVIP